MAPLTLGSIFVALFSVVAGDCTGVWHPHGSSTSCYFVSHDSEDWPGALTMCQLFGGQLAEINDDAEGQLLSNLTTRGKPHHKGHYWIGITDVNEEGAYVWAHSKLQLTAGTSIANWGKGQPDNGGGNQNCVFLNGNDLGHWYDGACHTAQNYICEKVAGSIAEIIG